MLPLLVRGSSRIHVRANGRGRARGRERVAELTTSARSYALVLILAAQVREQCVAQEGIVGRGRASE